MSSPICVHEVLPWSPISAERGSKLLPVLSTVDIENGKAETIRCTPPHAVRTSAFSSQHRPMPRYPSVHLYRLAAPDFNLLPVELRLLRRSPEQIVARLLIQLLLIEVHYV